MLAYVKLNAGALGVGKCLAYWLNSVVAAEMFN